MQTKALTRPLTTVTLREITNGQSWVGLGIAGNQAEHLDQAGEADDFKDVVALDNAPKGIFPWYIPGADSFLGTDPLSSDSLRLGGNTALQPEPEIALIVKFQYTRDTDTSAKQLDSLTVLGFSAFNDCSRRVPAAKISMKKNWGAASQGMAEQIVPIQDFSASTGTIESYRLACYLERDGELLQYGKDTAVSDYCYFNDTLVDWITHQINTQQDHGPLEPIATMLADTKPEYGVIGIGATCYSALGNSVEKFLKAGDRVIVVTYDSTQYTQTEVESKLQGNHESIVDSSFVVLKQGVA